MTGLRSQQSMKRDFMPTPVCSELRLFSREAITLFQNWAGQVNERYRDFATVSSPCGLRALKRGSIRAQP
jgi:hypothetical protein